ncbi:MAG: hypothetical protein JNJ56_03645 [Ignavibacteria bacterium]|nr:hypothetical protein [Ignavibacteria bacterium]
MNNKLNKHLSKLIPVLSFSFILTSFAIAQENELVIEDLKVPVSPAFTILGVTPASIEKPQTPKALGVSLLNAFNNVNIIPGNYSFEAAPYWLFDHPDLTFKDYYNSSPGQTLLNNLALSLATAPLDSPKSGTALAIGIRTLLFSGKANDALNSKLNLYLHQVYGEPFRVDMLNDLSSENLKTVTDLENEINNSVSAAKENPVELKNLGNSKTEYLTNLQNTLEEIINSSKFRNKNDTLSNEEMNELIEKVISESDIASDKNIKSALTEARSEDKKRKGFSLEFAGALSADFVNDSTSNGKISGIGGWINPLFSTDFMDFVGTMRFLSYLQDGITENKYDAGVRFIVSTDVFGISAEALVRASSELTPTYRYALNIDYRMTKNVYITGTFGKNFDGSPVNGNGDLITLLGINFGMGNEPVIKLPH